ncbi:MAG: transposase [Woronichinia naegeliana WA131]|uniref:Transposase n=1 Tax=Woronichinia naegeliana WA131 TaxID=2824559 RepID=A0A977L1C4_9CYAN|nr:MAG: transposase [Woronichinia naegeliana WA131]
MVHGFSYITFIFHETPFSYTFQAFCPVLRAKLPETSETVIAMNFLVMNLSTLLQKTKSKKL